MNNEELIKTMRQIINLEDEISAGTYKNIARIDKSFSRPCIKVDSINLDAKETEELVDVINAWFCKKEQNRIKTSIIERDRLISKLGEI